MYMCIYIYTHMTCGYFAFQLKCILDAVGTLCSMCIRTYVCMDVCVHGCETCLYVCTCACLRACVRACSLACLPACFAVSFGSQSKA